MQRDKYTVAWFKIAECISRGEKERALGVYRLLSHSFNDDAVARQLEADIYFSCQEYDQAIALYQQAFELYKKSKRFMEAAAIGEHLVCLVPHDVSLKKEIIVCYNNLGFISKIHEHSQYLIEAYIRDNKWQDLECFAFENSMLSDSTVRRMVYQQIIVAAHAKGGLANLMMKTIKKGVNDFLEEGHEQELQEFLAMLCAIDEELYQYALESLDKE